MNRMHAYSPIPTQKAFTIVELLIVIVVIAILAAIGIVAYSGIQNRSYDTTIQNDLRQTANSIAMFRVDSPSGRPPNTGEELNETFTTTRSAYHPTTGALLYCMNNDHFGIAARSRSGNIFYYSSANGGFIETGRQTIAGQDAICPELGIDNRNFGSWPKNVNWASWFTPGA